jgi:tetratricopeptide (TPR) repeat protein
MGLFDFFKKKEVVVSPPIEETKKDEPIIKSEIPGEEIKNDEAIKNISNLIEEQEEMPPNKIEFTNANNQVVIEQAKDDIYGNTPKVADDKAKVNNSKVTLSSVARISGIDEDFINLIYFPTDQEKQNHREKINSALAKLKIKWGAEYNKVYEKIIDYNNIELNEPIPFMIESLLIENFDVKKDINGKTETKSETVVKGIEKIQDYYSAASFISENILLKLNSLQTDFSFEENMFNTIVSISHLNNLAKLNSIFSLGLAFFKANKIAKAEQYFELLEKGQFDMQPSTIASFYKNIGELYAESSDKSKALKWLNAGLVLNPKLSVKKLITKLETNK